jgi:hypothetical protein
MKSDGEYLAIDPPLRGCKVEEGKRFIPVAPGDKRTAPNKICPS